MNESRVKKNEVLQLMNERTLIMGIVNTTPDSFSDGGQFDMVDAAVAHALALVEAGADMIDIGAESTRPNAVQVSIEEELRRVIPIIEAIAKETTVPISIDTYKAEVAKQALEAGATMINDIWGAKWDKEMAKVASDYTVPIVLMHNRKKPIYTHLINEMISDLQESVAICKKAGVKNEYILIDPGIGFAKSHEQNLEVMRNLDAFVALGYPVLLGTSRKSIVAKTLNLPINERVEGTGATVCYGIMKGCQMMRVHDVLEMSRMAKMMDALMMKDGGANG